MTKQVTIRMTLDIKPFLTGLANAMCGMIRMSHYLKKAKQ